MNSTGNKPPKSEEARSGNEETKKSKSVRVKLTQGERDLLLKICNKYRHTIPTYIKSRQGEIGMLEEIIDKLS